MGFRCSYCLQFFRGETPWLLAMRWLILLLLWQGPIPWCHSHELWAGAGEEARSVSVDCDVMCGCDRSLLDHLYAFHSADRDSTHTSTGWHLHWVIPEVDKDTLPPGPATSELPGAEPSVVITGGQDSMLASISAKWLLETVSGLGASFADVRPSVPRHFLDTYAASLAMPLKLGILRC